MDPALNQNEPELGISVLPVPLKMLPDGDGLLDQVVAILGQLWGHALALQDTEDLVAGNETDLDELKVKASRFISSHYINALILPTDCQDSRYTQGAEMSPE